MNVIPTGMKDKSGEWLILRDGRLFRIREHIADLKQKSEILNSDINSNIP